MIWLFVFVFASVQLAGDLFDFVWRQEIEMLVKQIFQFPNIICERKNEKTREKTRNQEKKKEI